MQNLRWKLKWILGKDVSHKSLGFFLAFFFPHSMDAMEYAQFMKQDGNQDFKNGNYALAIRKYDQALYMLVQLRQWGL